MTRDEAISIMNVIVHMLEPQYDTDRIEDAVEMAIKALEQQPTDAVDRVTIKEYLYSLGMGIKVTATDAVDRQTALEAFGLSEKSRKYGGDHSGYDTLMKYEIQDILEDLPSVTPMPKMGTWVRMSDLSEDVDDRYKCSKCGNVVHSTDRINLYTFHRWCGRCGSNNDVAKMQEV